MVANNPRYPVYIISKGRWESRLTQKYLESINVLYHIVIEPQEYDQYAQFINPKKIKVLPFSNLGQGSIPARNWVWEDSIQRGYERHWILDDNIRAFYRLNNNIKYYIKDGTCFYVAEEFTNRYTNIGLSGFQYSMFAPRKEKLPPFIINTRIYSCILINNSLPIRWRGRYNEDTDLSLRVLKKGLCTVLFYAFLADKTTTMKMKGGNTDQLYKQNDNFDGRLAMAQSLQKQHPDVVTITHKWGRYQHKVDYRPFRKNKLILRDDIVINQRVNNYGMDLVKYN